MITDHDSDELPQALAAFDLGGAVEVQAYRAGHINDSYIVTAGRPDFRRRFLAQRINPVVFADPAAIMANIVAVTRHLRAKTRQRGGDPARQTLTLRPTVTGDWWYTAADGAVWRVYDFIEGTVCYEVAPSTGVLHAAARAFGQFARDLEDFPAADLTETIPGFHDTARRHASFVAAVAADSVGRAQAVGRDIDFGLARADDCQHLTGALAAGQLTLRVTHKDTKLTNVLIDPVSRVGCVVDLDTVMPGLLAYDYGDALRMGASTAGEDEADLDRVHLSLALVEAFTTGYLATAGAVMTPAEIASLPWGERTMTLECGLRFLTDYLEGDRYFRTSRPGHNLDRARAQFALVAEIERHFDALEAVVTRVSAGIGRG